MGAEMREYISKLTTNGQTTVPAEVRRHLGIRTGDRVSFCIGADGHVHLRPAPYPSIESIRAAAAMPQQLAWDEMLSNSREDRLLELYGTFD